MASGRWLTCLWYSSRCPPACQLHQGTVGWLAGRQAGAGCYTLPSMRAIHQLQGMMIRQITLPPW